MELIIANDIKQIEINNFPTCLSFIGFTIGYILLNSELLRFTDIQVFIQRIGTDVKLKIEFITTICLSLNDAEHRLR